MRPTTDLPNVAGGYALPLDWSSLWKRGRRAHESCATQRTTLIRAAVMDLRVRAPARSPVIWSLLGGGRAPNGIQWGVLCAGRGKPASLRFDTTLDITARNTSPIGRHSELATGLALGSAARTRMDTTIHPSRTAPWDERGTKPTRWELRQKTGTLTRRYRTQLHCYRHLQGGEPRRNTGEQLHTCDSPCLEERSTEDALWGSGPTGNGGLRQHTQMRRELGRNTTRRN